MTWPLDLSDAYLYILLLMFYAFLDYKKYLLLLSCLDREKRRIVMRIRNMRLDSSLGKIGWKSIFKR